MRRTSIIAALALSGAAVFAGVAPAQASTTGTTGTTGVTATYVGGIQFWDSNYQGASYTITNSGTCNNSLDVDYSLSQFSGGWNDQISSFQAYSNCGETLYEHGNFGGASYGVYYNSSYVGDAMNDKASSLTFH